MDKYLRRLGKNIFLKVIKTQTWSTLVHLIKDLYTKVGIQSTTQTPKVSVQADITFIIKFGVQTRKSGFKQGGW